MLQTYWTRSTALAAVFVAATTAAERVSAQQVLDLPDARVEIRGLRSWTPQMLVDSLAVRGERLDSHACAAVLRSQLGFADASVMIFPQGWEGRPKKEYIINLIEPADSARVRYRDIDDESHPARAEWSDLLALLESDMQAYHTVLRAGLPVAAADADGTAADAAGGALLRLLAQRRSASDLHTARRVLAEDGHALNRAVAASIVAGFPAEDAAWVTLVQTLTDRHAFVAGSAIQALHGLHTRHARVVDWSAAHGTLRDVLSGTNLFAYDLVLELLVATGEPRTIRDDVLRGTDLTLVIEMLGSIDGNARRRAHRFLTHFFEVDHRTDQERWRAVLARDEGGE